MFNEVFDRFLNFDLPCPEEIPFCQEWRDKYQQDIQQASAGGCTKCKLLNIKARYMTLLHVKYHEKLDNTKKI